jgi:hypothetical protein
MGLIENLSKMMLGLGGNKPKNFTPESPMSTLHYTSSTNGNPPFAKGSKANPSLLDEADSTNKNKFKSSKGQKYTDRLFR